MLRKQALQRTLSAVTKGDLSTVSAEHIHAAFGAHYQRRFWEAYQSGSLDAAKEIHEALLPEYLAKLTIGAAGAGVTKWHCVVEDWEEGDEFCGDNQPSPARAWLIAIISALIAQEASQ